MVETVKLFIAGERTEGTGRGAYVLRSPGSGGHLANVPIASRDDLDRAIAGARPRTSGKHSSGSEEPPRTSSGAGLRPRGR